jgi:putative ABC transport system substrate-binding protein
MQFDQVNRRNLITLLGSTAVAWPLVADAQKTQKTYRIGYLAGEHIPISRKTGGRHFFLRGMKDLGYVEGNDFVIEWRSADWKFERLRELDDRFRETGRHGTSDVFVDSPFGFD